MEFIMNAQALFLAGSVVLVVSAMTFGGSLQAPSGLFKDLNDATVSYTHLTLPTKRIV